nr:molybdopterin-dependent oxidoreductase [Saprospiraceae bacterium]
HPPAFGMSFRAYDREAVLAMPGIRDVFEIDLRPEGIETQWSDVTAFPKLIAIVGESTWQVMKARKAINVDWVQDTPAESSSEHAAILEDLLSKPSSLKDRRDGNPEAAFSNAAKVVERTFTAPFLAHNTLEPMNFFADVRDGKAELLGPIQTPEFLQKTVAALLDIPLENVSIMMTRMGGGFGRRLYGHFGSEAALISHKVGAPIKLIYSREDDMTQGTYRPAYSSTYRAALDANGNLTGFQIKGAGMKDDPVFLNRFPAGAVENYLAENQIHRDTNVSTGAWRAPGSNFTAGVEQAFLDEVAEAAGMDPIEFRLKLFERASANPVGEDHDYDAERYAGVLKLVRDKSGWGQERPGVYRGVSAYYCHNSYVAQVVDVVMEDGAPRVQKVWCAVDCGIVINPGSAKNQIEGGIVDGIGHAMYSAMTFTDGKPNESNFDRYRLIRNAEAPLEIETFFVDNGIDPTGLGEPSLPPISGALANALYRATGERLQQQPFNRAEAVLG